jgi:hypothetical protein
MFNFRRKNWAVVVQKTGDDNIVAQTDFFIVRDHNAWDAFDAVKALCTRRSNDKETWRPISMIRV